MTDPLINFPDPFEVLSRLPALVVGTDYGTIVTLDGEVMAYDLKELKKIVRGPFLFAISGSPGKTLGTYPIGPLMFWSFLLLSGLRNSACPCLSGWRRPCPFPTAVTHQRIRP
ncbi:MAG: hypothetical protein GXP00_05745 [Alphaproteobacteria bacterium]|nr:hypothetical protein [Alphaproteobacteria bacterium]